MGGGAAYRHRSPYNFPQAPAEEHRLTQRSNNRLHSKIALIKRTYKNLSQGELKRPSSGHFIDHYWGAPLPHSRGAEAAIGSYYSAADK